VSVSDDVGRLASTVPEACDKIVSVSVVIPTHNGWHHLATCLSNTLTECASLAEPFEILVVDNGSTDGTLVGLRRQEEAVNVMALEHNCGFAEACNRGVRAAKGEYCLLLNNDAWCAPGALAELLAFARTGYSIAGPILVNPDGTFQSGPMTIDFLGDPVQSNVLERPFFVCGAALLVNRTDFLTLGGFDDRFFAFYEEADLQWRAHLAKCRVGCDLRATVYHIGGGTLAGALLGYQEGAVTTTWQRLYLGRRNQLAMLLKNYSRPSLAFALACWGLSGAIECMGATALGHAGLWRAYAAAVGWNMRNIRATWKRRRIVQRTRCVDDGTIRRYFGPPFTRLRTAFRLARRLPRIQVR